MVDPTAPDEWLAARKEAWRALAAQRKCSRAEAGLDAAASDVLAAAGAECRALAAQRKRSRAEAGVAAAAAVLAAAGAGEVADGAAGIAGGQNLTLGRVPTPPNDAFGFGGEATATSFPATAAAAALPPPAGRAGRTMQKKCGVSTCGTFNPLARQACSACGARFRPRPGAARASPGSSQSQTGRAIGRPPTVHLRLQGVNPRVAGTRCVCFEENAHF